MTDPRPMTTDFSRDVVGRYVCNGLDEALASSDPRRPDTRPFDVIVIGGGSFGPILAQRLFHASKRARILVLEAGPLVLPEHVQNMPMLGLRVPGPSSIADLRASNLADQPREEVWGLPWHSSVKFPGLVYALGGRSAYFGGWSPPLLAEEMPPEQWPAQVVADLRDRYFAEAAAQIGTDVTNDFIYGELHNALRRRVFDAVEAGDIRHAVPLGDLPDHPMLAGTTLTNGDLRDALGLDDTESLSGTLRHMLKLEAPLAVQSRTRAGFFPFNKFSALPLLIQAARAAWAESNGSDARKRLMVVPNCHVKRTVLRDGRVWRVETHLGDVPVVPGAVVVLAAGTIESARLALLSFGGVANAHLIGRNLMAHLRSNLTIRVPRTSLPDATAQELQTSALFVKGSHSVNGSARYFHLQVTAAGLGSLGTDSEAELFKKVPDVDTFDRFRSVTDTHVVVTIRGIGEMEPHSPNSYVGVDPEVDEFGQERAFVAIAPTEVDRLLWKAMDEASDDLALALAGGEPYEVLTPTGLVALPPDEAPSAALSFDRRHDGMGTTHHEAGTLWMGSDPASSVTTPDAAFHAVPNAYVAGPALLPTIGSPNPMLSGTALARRLADHLAHRWVGSGGPEALFDGQSADNWRMAGTGSFTVADGVLEVVPGDDLGLCWCTTPLPPDFVLSLEWRRTRPDDNSGVFVRFPNPNSKGYTNTAYVPVHFGFEVQIDEQGAPDGAEVHRTGAVYGEATAQLSLVRSLPPGEWNLFQIEVSGDAYGVRLNDQEVCRFVNPHVGRGAPTTRSQASFMGIQAHSGRVAFRNIYIAQP